MSIDTGDLAPDFILPTDQGDPITLSEQRGRPVVLYFYPKANTSGCTKQALLLRDSFSDFTNAQAIIVGVSKDPVAQLAKFKAKHDLPFILASDADRHVCTDYGVWVKKSMYGREYMGIERSTFLIDRYGTIAQAWRKVKVPGHVEHILQAVLAL